MYFRICCLAFYSITFVVGITDNDSQDNTTAKPGQFPYQASLQQSNQHICGASILSNYWLLTAAHCFKNSKITKSYTVLVGTTNLSRGGVRHSVKCYLKHPFYYKYTFDIAIIKVSRRLSFNKFVNKINLPHTDTKADTRVVLTGWGLTNYKPEQETTNLRYIYIDTITNMECNLYYGLKVTGLNVCTSTKNGKGSCLGDSGGPLVDPKTKAQVGIVSGGTPCAVGKPDIYTRIYNYVPWITFIIKF